jgi:diadenosine tetraphosphate (Ap4A) HIT family hydrolase/predicted house-cleaning noncanonical NTP pyrophosphatase (MazG superfamily)
MDEKEFTMRLKDKLLEEAAEVKHAQNEQEITEELADVLEIIHTLSNVYGISMEQIEEARIEKHRTEGGFDLKIFNSHVEIEENNQAINYFVENSEQYPLIQPQEQPHNCLFCEYASGKKIVKIFETFTHCYAIKDQFPVSMGHILIIPNEHTENWFTAREEVRQDMMKALHVLKDRLDLEYCPQGYNIGANCGQIAGQSVMHLHLHLIPRYKGDMEDPKGGVRGVIPSKQKY